MIRLFIFFLLTATLFGATVQRSKWLAGESYLGFLERNNLPLRPLYYNLDKDDQKLTEEIRSGITYEVLKDNNDTIEQMLLPLNDELQVHIYKTAKSYKFEVIPIIYKTVTEAFCATIKSSPLNAIYRETGRKRVAQAFVSSFKHSLNFKNGLRSGDRLVMIYKQKYRLGQPFSVPTLKCATIEMQNKTHSIYRNSDGNYYDENGRQVNDGNLLGRPIPGARISSYFSKRRWDPYLHKWRAHLGVDFAARRGVPIHAAGDGRIIRAARSASYGNVIYIQHAGGYSTRYAHMKHFRRGMHYGKYVKKGQVIGYVGATGWATGPHLHFEVRYHNRAINPLHVVQIATKKLTGKKRKQFLRLKRNYDESLQLHLNNETKFHKTAPFEDMCYVHLIKSNNDENRTN